MRVAHWDEVMQAIGSRVLGGQRAGQAVFNTLWEYAPGEVEQLRGSAVDPFHHDDRVRAFLEALEI